MDFNLRYRICIEPKELHNQEVQFYWLNSLSPVTKEKLHGKIIYIAESPVVNVASQGETLEGALENLKDALISYFKSPYADKSKLKAYGEMVLFGEISLPKKLV